MRNFLFLLLSAVSAAAAAPVIQTPMTLVNVNTGATQPFKEGMSLDSNIKYYIRIESAISTQSVVFDLDGKTELPDNFEPYLSDPMVFPEGDHTMKATPWSKDNAKGKSGKTVVINFSVPATASPTVTPTPSPTATPTPTATASPTATATPTPLPTVTPSPTPITPSPSPSAGVSPTNTPTPSPSTTITPSPTSTPSPTTTVSPSPSPSPTITPTPAATPEVTGFTYNGGQPFTSGASLVLNTTYTIQANATGTQSVAFSRDNGYGKVIDVTPPYEYTLHPGQLGSHQLDAVPWSGNNATGTAGATYSVPFQVVGAEIAQVSVTVSWTWAETLGHTYKLYWGKQSGSYTSNQPATNGMKVQCDPNATYYFAMTSSANGAESLKGPETVYTTTAAAQQQLNIPKP